jgi:hypothetical protein
MLYIFTRISLRFLSLYYFITIDREKPQTVVASIHSDTVAYIRLG